MRDYGKVLPSFWIGETGKKLRSDAPAQVLAMYLMTCPHSTWTGVYHCPILYMAHETGLGMEGASKALARLLEVGFCTYDEASEVVFVIKMAAYQIATTIKPNDKRHKGILKDVENMSPPSVKAQFIATYSVAFNLPQSPKNTSPLGDPSKAHASQEQEQEQEQELCAPSAGVARPDAPPQAAAPPPAALPNQKTGTRMPDGWVLPDDWRRWAQACRPDLDVDMTAESFRDFWIAKPGKDGRKADWLATWRNWVRGQRAGPLIVGRGSAEMFAGAI